MNVENLVPVAHRTRNGHVEMVHFGCCYACNDKGETLLEVGKDSGSQETFFRSAVKIWQAQILIKSGAADHFGFTEQELALCVSSHNGEEIHVNAAKSMLKKMGLNESHLSCGAHEPLSKDAAKKVGENFSTVHSNCSGKHCGNFFLCCLLFL